MKVWSVIVLLCLIIFVKADVKCRSDEYTPGPNCGLEPTCAPRSSHSYPKHTCDCWCKPGTYRVIDTNDCVTLEHCH